MNRAGLRPGLVVLLLALGIPAILWLGPSGDDGAAPTTTVAATPTIDRGVVTVPVDGAAIHGSPNGASEATLGGGLVLPIDSVVGDWVEVTTTCSTSAWLRAGDVELHERANAAAPGPGFDLSAAVIVLDPGHGGRLTGAKGPSGLFEKVPNLDIADRVRALLAAPRDVDWTTGDITAGVAYPAVASIFMTRDPDAVEAGDFEASLAYRAAVATEAGADAFISIHNNTVPKGTRNSPGTQVFYSVGAPGSDRLATLLYDEVKAALSVFDVPWSGLSDAGARAYTDGEGADYFTVLSGTSPGVIVEGMYLSEPAEEALLQTAEGRQAYAEGVYRGLLRYLTTDEWGTDPLPTAPWPGASPGSPSNDGCVLPTVP